MNVWMLLPSNAAQLQDAPDEVQQDLKGAAGYKWKPVKCGRALVSNPDPGQQPEGDSLCIKELPACIAGLCAETFRNVPGLSLQLSSRRCQRQRQRQRRRRGGRVSVFLQARVGPVLSSTATQKPNACTSSGS
ncbi:hypothetical protein AAFF_G00288910 [Aldrovandia affinis]|uniref:Uncharacterized protein n=1 Tax=Aldrovandia affinis TaxID=143900 RepID=A0AAD7SRD2_9TELE|nr:hypothetical protein AAFF_G00288910 [Aldrovandia affinis]